MAINLKKDKSVLQKEILLFGITEICIGLTGVVLADFTSVFNILVLFSGLAGVTAIAFCVIKPASIKVYDFLGMALMLAYGIGTLNSLISFTLDGNDLLLHLPVSEYWLSRTLGLTTAAAGFLHVVGRFDNQGYLFPHFTIVDKLENRALWLIGIVAVISVIFIATGKLGFMANVSAVAGYVGVSYSSSIVLELIGPAGALSLYLSRINHGYKYKIFFVIFATILLGIQFGLGRRIFAFSTYIYLIAAVFAKPPKKVVSIRNLLVLVAIFIIVQSATYFFYTMRIASNAFKNAHKSPSVVELVPEAINVYKNREKLFVAQQIHENVSSRTFVLEYLTAIAEATSKIEPLYGQDLHRAFVVATPSIFYWRKYSDPLFLDEETLLNPHLRLPVKDEANSILTASIGDFGEIGMFILPALVCFIYSLYLRVIYSILPPIGGMLLSFFICKVMLTVEEDVVLYIGSSRTVIILTLIAWLTFCYKISNTNKISIAFNDVRLKLATLTGEIS